MIRFTTPTLSINLIDNEGNRLTDFVFDYLVVSIKSKDVEINKKIPYSSVVEGNFKVDFTQEETGQMKENNPLDVQINIWLGDDRIASQIKHFTSSKNLLNRVIEDYE